MKRKYALLSAQTELEHKVVNSGTRLIISVKCTLARMCDTPSMRSCLMFSDNHNNNRVY